MSELQARIRWVQGLNHGVRSWRVGVMNIWTESAGSPVASLSVYNPATGADGDSVRVHVGDEVTVDGQMYRVVEIAVESVGARAWLEVEPIASSRGTRRWFRRG
jgi:hypothetical protein